MAKKNINTKIDDAPIVIAVGPGFTAKKDCDYVIETKRGHFLGKVIEEGSAIKKYRCSRKYWWLYCRANYQS